MYGPENILLFNLCVIIAYKVLMMCAEVQMFALNRVLPSETFKRRQRQIVYATIATSIFLLIVYVTLSIIWYVDFEEQALMNLRLVLLGVQVILYFVVSWLYFIAAYKIAQTRKIVTAGLNQHRFHSLRVQFNIYTAGYSALWMACLFELLVTGTYNMWNSVADIIILVVYDAIKVQLLIILAKLPLDTHLKTQVLESGKICILVSDEFDKEVMRFYIDKSAANDPNCLLERKSNDS